MCSILGGFNMSIDSLAFKGVYKVTLPNVKEAKNEQEKAAYTDAVINTVVMGANASVSEPKFDKDSKSIYFKINDKNDAKFEEGFTRIMDDCNKRFNIDMANKAYIQKVSEDEYNKLPSDLQQ